jgi:hypothetical protein
MDLKKKSMPLMAKDDSALAVKYLHPNELINGDIDLSNPLFANHIKSLMSLAEMTKPQGWV